jgi:hypothetical protein
LACASGCGAHRAGRPACARTTRRPSPACDDFGLGHDGLRQQLDQVLRKAPNQRRLPEDRGGD